MIKVLISFSFFCISFYQYSYSQLVMNGDFEQAPSICGINLSNTEFNNVISDVKAFGSGNNLDVLNTACGFGNPQSGSWYIGLASSGQNLDFDALSLTLAQNLVQGKAYNITYYEQATDTFSAGSSPLILGLAESDTSLGSTIFSSTPVVDQWTRRSFNFIAPNNGKYLTIKILNNDFSWNFVDNISLDTGTSGIKNHHIEQIKLFPNPSNNGYINITFSTSEKPKLTGVYNLAGDKVSHEFNGSLYGYAISIKHPPGIYFIELEFPEGVIRKKIILAH